MTDITLIVCGIFIILIGVIGFVFMRYIKPWLATKINAEQWSIIISWAETLVSLAEKTIYGEHGLGGLRFEKVLEQLQELCNKYNYQFDDNMLKSAIQYAWQTIIGVSEKDKKDSCLTTDASGDINV